LTVTFVPKPEPQSLLTEYVTWHCTGVAALAVPGTRTAALAAAAATAVAATAPSAVRARADGMRIVTPSAHIRGAAT
jgi:hypothetical protein